MNPKKKRKLDYKDINLDKIIKKNNFLSDYYEKELNDSLLDYQLLFNDKLDNNEFCEVKEIIKKKKELLKRILKLSKFLINYKYDYLKDLLVIFEKLN